MRTRAAARTTVRAASPCGKANPSGAIALEVRAVGRDLRRPCGRRSIGGGGRARRRAREQRVARDRSRRSRRSGRGPSRGAPHCGHGGLAGDALVTGVALVSAGAAFSCGGDGGRGIDARSALVAVVRRRRVVAGGARRAHGASLWSRTVFVERVSSDISSTSSTWRLSRTVPIAGSSTSTTRRRSLSVPSLPPAGRQLHGAAELERRLRLVARAARLQTLLDDLGQLRLAGVVRDLAADARGERGLVRPDGADERLRDRLAVDDEAHAPGEDLVARPRARRPGR